jgi:hypothetical protein
MSWKPQIKASTTGQWCPNGLAFATKPEAEAYCVDLLFRWSADNDYRAVESDQEVNSRWGERHGLESIADIGEAALRPTGADSLDRHRGRVAQPITKNITAGSINTCSGTTAGSPAGAIRGACGRPPAAR